MKNLILFILILLSCFACNQKQATNQSNGDKALLENLTAKRVTLPNGWALTPVGKSLNLNDLPLNLVVSPSQKFLAVTNNGQSTQSIMLIDAVSERILDEVSIK